MDTAAIASPDPSPRAAAPPAPAAPLPSLGAALRPLLLAQFATTFVGNAATFFAAFLIAGGRGADEAALQRALTTTFLLGIVPMALASFPAAWLADRFAKPMLLRVLALVLIAILAASTTALLLSGGAADGAAAARSVLPLQITVALVGIQGALFSPAKYGVLPELVAHERLSDANGRLELWNFIAIVAGSGAGGFLADRTAATPWLGTLLLGGLAVVGFLAARRVPARPASGSGEALGVALAGGWRAIRGDGLLLLAVCGSMAFWGIGKLIGQDLVVDAKVRLLLPDTWASLLLALLPIGVGVGSAIAGRISGRKVELGLLPLGALLMGGAALVLGLGGAGNGSGEAPRGWGRFGTCAWLLVLGSAGGLLLVPLNALLQWRAPAARRGAVIALSNVLVYAGVGMGAASAALLARAGLSTRAIFGVAGLLLLIGGVVATARAPQALVRLVLFLLTHTLYRLRVHGREHVPEHGGALLVPNHVSFVDGLLVIASLDRPVRFLVDASFFERPLLGHALRWFGAIPISSAGGPRMILRAFREAGQHLDDGHLVCIFAEGQITRNGLLNPFRRGLERIVKGRNAPIIPVHLDGVWGSIFSYAGGRFVTKRPERIPYPVQVSFGPALPTATPIHAVRRAVTELGSEAWRARRGGSCSPMRRRRRSRGCAPRRARSRWPARCADRSATSATSACCCRRRSARRSPTWRSRSRAARASTSTSPPARRRSIRRRARRGCATCSPAPSSSPAPRSSCRRARSRSSSTSCCGASRAPSGGARCCSRCSRRSGWSSARAGRRARSRPTTWSRCCSAAARPASRRA